MSKQSFFPSTTQEFSREIQGSTNLSLTISGKIPDSLFSFSATFGSRLRLLNQFVIRVTSFRQRAYLRSITGPEGSVEFIGKATNRIVALTKCFSTSDKTSQSVATYLVFQDIPNKIRVEPETKFLAFKLSPSRPDTVAKLAAALATQKSFEFNLSTSWSKAPTIHSWFKHNQLLKIVDVITQDTWLILRRYETGLSSAKKSLFKP